nr:hypothetical protein [Microbacterium rhizomatis]
MVCVDATSMYLAQKRLDSLADAAALAGSDGFTLAGGAAGGPTADLTDADVQAQAGALVADAGTGAELVSAAALDGISARVTVATTWHPPIITLLVPGGVALESTATSRSGLH